MENSNKKMCKLLQGDNMESFKKLPDNSIDSVVTDGPYGLSFMGKKWDYDVPSVEFWKEVYRVLKPGGHVLSFGGTRTYHRMVVNIEDAGFEIRDQIMWIYGSGFPKSHNIGKQKGCEEWEGFGTALKPANEPICVARKPLSEKSVAENVLKWGTGGINIDGCRIGTEDKLSRPVYKSIDTNIYGGGKGMPPIETLGNDEGRFPANIIFDESAGEMLDEQSGVSGSKKRTNFKKDNTIWQENTGETDTMSGGFTDKGGASRFFYVAKVSKSERNMGLIETLGNDEGRFPANIIFDESAAELLDEQSGITKTKADLNYKHNKTESSGEVFQSRGTYTPREDKGGASRFFYIPKVSKSERNMGLDGFEEKTSGGKGHGLDRRCSYCNTSMLKPEDCKCETPDWITPPKKNTHPTLKPVQLMAYLCRLVTPPNGIVLDPFMGSGSTGISACLEGFRFVGMEMSEEYFKIAEARIENYELYRPFVEKKKKK